MKDWVWHRTALLDQRTMDRRENLYNKMNLNYLFILIFN